MKSTIKKLIQEFEEITKFKIFEIEVINKENKEIDYIIFNIEINDHCLYASHESLTFVQEESNKVAYVSIELDECYSLDEHLQQLHEECINAIIESDFYLLSDNY